MRKIRGLFIALLAAVAVLAFFARAGGCAAEAQHPRHLGRRHRPVQHQRLQQGLMGYRTPNIDRLAREGVLFTDWYGQQSCTAGRAAFITGQSSSAPASPRSACRARRRACRRRTRPSPSCSSRTGYTTGQFGKNHLGDRNEYAADGPRLRRVLRQPLPPQRRGGAGELSTTRRTRSSRQRFGPRGVLDARRRTGRPDRGPALGQGRQADIEDTGPLTRKRMETIDEEDTRPRRSTSCTRQARPESRSSSGATPPACTSSRT